MHAVPMSSSRLARGRLSVCGQIYAITTVVAGRKPLLAEPMNAEVVVQCIDEAERDGAVLNLAWVLMPDHLHWLFRLDRGDLAGCVGRLKSRSGRVIHQSINVQGAFWQAGYFDHALRDDDSVRRHARYIAANPLRAGLCRHVGEYRFGWCRWPL